LLGAPRWWEVASASAILAAGVLAVPALLRRAGKAEPDWAVAAALHERSLASRVPAETLAMALGAKDSLAREARCVAAYIHVPRCTSQGQPHFGACCFGGSLPTGGRLLVIIGEHMASEPTQVVEAVLAHERGHVAGWRMYAHVLARIAGSLGLAIITWSVASPVTAVIACAVLVAAAKVLTWAVELSCDRLSARQTSPEAMIEALNFKDRTVGAVRARRPAWMRWPLFALECVGGFDHPPSSMRRSALTGLSS
jgi:Zn-dependent protease with chaperone function